MFKKKNTYINIEFLEEGKYLIKSNINKDTNPYMVSNFVNGLITREYLEDLLEVILKTSHKNNVPEVGEEIVSSVMELQENLVVKFVNPRGRNPMIKPSEVMKQFTVGDSHE